MKYQYFLFKKFISYIFVGQAWLHTSVISATAEEEAGGSQFKNSPDKVIKTPSQ
jgi:hypothetical protein